MRRLGADRRGKRAAAADGWQPRRLPQAAPWPPSPPPPPVCLPSATHHPPPLHPMAVVPVVALVTPWTQAKVLGTVLAAMVPTSAGALAMHHR